MDDDNLNSTLVRESKKRQKAFPTRRFNYSAARINGSAAKTRRNWMFFRQIIEKQREAEAVEGEK